MPVSFFDAQARAESCGLLNPLHRNCGRRLRFDFNTATGRDAGCLVASVKDAYTVSRGEIGELDKVVLKIMMETVRGHRVHSLAYDLVEERWTFFIREGYDHPAFTNGTVFFVGDDGIEPEIEHSRISSVIHSARLPISLSLLIGAPFRFYVTKKTGGSHYLAGVVESVEVSESAARLHVVAPPFLGCRLKSLSWGRGVNWKIDLEQNSEINSMQGELDLELAEAIADAQVVRIA